MNIAISEMVNLLEKYEISNRIDQWQELLVCFKITIEATQNKRELTNTQNLKMRQLSKWVPLRITDFVKHPNTIINKS